MCTPDERGEGPKRLIPHRLRNQAQVKPTSGTDVLSPEMLALLACARGVLDPDRAHGLRAALSACRSSDRLCHAAMNHGMVGLLNRALAAEGGIVGPEGLKDHLAAMQRAAAGRCLRQTGQLVSILEKLRLAGVPAVPIKGPVWAEWLYGDVSMRDWTDLDIVVPFAAVPEVREMLLAAGLRDMATYDARLLRRESRTEGELHFATPDEALMVDVHWQVGVGYTAAALQAEDLIARAVPRSLLGREVGAPSPVDALLIGCLHGARHRWESVELLLSVAMQVQDLQPAGWHSLLAAARRTGCARRVVVGVAHVCRVLGAPLPAEVRGALARDAVSRALLGSLGPESLAAGERQGIGGEHLVYLTWTVSAEDSLRAGIEHAVLRAFRPGPEDWQSLTLPKDAEWLYWILRPPRLALKWALAGVEASLSRGGRAS